MSKPAPKMKFTTLWNPIELPVKEVPSQGMAAVQRLDDEVLVLQTNQQINLFIGLGMVVALGMIAILTFTMFFVEIDGKMAFVSVFFDGVQDEHPFSSTRKSLFWGGIFLFLSFLFLSYFIFTLLNLSLLQPRPCPVVLNRRTKKLMLRNEKMKKR